MNTNSIYTGIRESSNDILMKLKSRKSLPDLIAILKGEDKATTAGNINLTNYVFELVTNGKLTQINESQLHRDDLYFKGAIIDKYSIKYSVFKVINYEESLTFNNESELSFVSPFVEDEPGIVDELGLMFLINEKQYTDIFKEIQVNSESGYIEPINNLIIGDSSGLDYLMK